MIPWEPDQPLRLTSGGRSWSARAVWLTSLMNDSVPSAELALAPDDLQHLLAHPITVQSGDHALTYPPPAAPLAERFTAACAAFKGSHTLRSVTPTVEIVHPGKP